MRAHRIPVAVHVLACLLAWGAWLCALDPHRLPTQYRIDTWQREAGLPSSSVEAVLQTKDGYIWLGTHDGLVRFDGVRFTTFARSDTPALGSNFIVALYETTDGDLWIGTDGGGLTRYRGGRFETYTTKNGLASDYILSLAQDSAGSLWIGTD